MLGENSLLRGRGSTGTAQRRNSLKEGKGMCLQHSASIPHHMKVDSHTRAETPFFL